MSDMLAFSRARRWAVPRTDWAPAPGTVVRPAGQRPPAPVIAHPGADERMGQARSLPPLPEPGRPLANPLFFSIRSFVCDDRSRTLEFAFVDGTGEAVFNAHARSPSDATRQRSAAPSPTTSLRLDGPVVEKALTAVCRRADLIGYHRLLQGGLLPQGALAGAGTLGCVSRRMQALTHLGGRAPTFEQALLLAGLRPPGEEDGLGRALAVRALWLWLDRRGA